MGLEPTLPRERDFESRASTNSATPALAGCGVFRALYTLSSGPSLENRCWPFGGPRISPRIMASRAAVGVASCSLIGRRRMVRFLRTTPACPFLTCSKALTSAGLRVGLAFGRADGMDFVLVLTEALDGVAGRGGGADFWVPRVSAGTMKSRILSCSGCLLYTSPSPRD